MEYNAQYQTGMRTNYDYPRTMPPLFCSPAPWYCCCCSKKIPCPPGPAGGLRSASNVHSSLNHRHTALNVDNDPFSCTTTIAHAYPTAIACLPNACRGDINEEDMPVGDADAPTICVPTPADTLAPALAPALVLEPVATVGAINPPTWVEPTENSTRKCTCFWTTAPVPSSTTSLVLHRNTAAVPPPWGCMLSGSSSAIVTPSCSRMRTVSVRVATRLFVEQCARQLKRLENHPLNSPTGDDKMDGIPGGVG